MLSFIRKTAARAWESTSHDALELDCSETQEDPALSVDVEELRHSFSHIPWHCIAQACSSTIVPVCTAVRDTVHNDIDSLARLLVGFEIDVEIATEADPAFEAEAPSSIPLSSLDPSIALEEVSGEVHNPHASACHKTLGRAPDSDVPTIVITPCVSKTRDRSGWVPFQDASFGNRLVVPTYQVVNGLFPPLLAKASPLVERWKFADGHWWALLPTLEEQMQRGMFSRPIHCRRRKSYVENCSRCLAPRPRSPSPARRACNAT